MPSQLPLRPLGLTGIEWTPIGLGTWNMETKPEASIKAIRAGIDAGANHVDTAEMYGSGEVESLVGKALEGLRDKVCLVSKVLPQNASRQGALDACHRSLKRLKTDHLDIYLLHWRENDTELEETFAAFEQLKKEGKIRHWGVSNFDVEDMEEAVSIAGAKNIACNQVLYYLKQRSIEKELIPWCEKNNIPVVAYSPLGQGRLPKSPVLDEIAKGKQATPAQLALAFLTRRSNTFAIPKTSHPARAEENIKAASIVLTEDEIKRIDQAFPVRNSKTLPMI